MFIRARSVVRTAPLVWRCSKQWASSAHNRAAQSTVETRTGPGGNSTPAPICPEGPTPRPDLCNELTTQDTSSTSLGSRDGLWRNPFSTRCRPGPCRPGVPLSLPLCGSCSCGRTYVLICRILGEATTARSTRWSALARPGTAQRGPRPNKALLSAWPEMLSVTPDRPMADAADSVLEVDLRTGHSGTCESRRQVPERPVQRSTGRPGPEPIGPAQRNRGANNGHHFRHHA
jgi:hypothetical protein